MLTTQAAPRPDARTTPTAAEVRPRLDPNSPPEWNQPHLTPDEISRILARADADEAARQAAEEAERLLYTPPAHLPGWINEAAEDICYHTGIPPRAVPLVAEIIARYSPVTRTAAIYRHRALIEAPPARHRALFAAPRLP